MGLWTVCQGWGYIWYGIMNCLPRLRLYLVWDYELFAKVEVIFGMGLWTVYQGWSYICYGIMKCLPRLRLYLVWEYELFAKVKVIFGMAVWTVCQCWCYIWYGSMNCLLSWGYICYVSMNCLLSWGYICYGSMNCLPMLMLYLLWEYELFAKVGDIFGMGVWTVCWGRLGCLSNVEAVSFEFDPSIE